MNLKITVVAFLLFTSILHGQNFEKTFNTRNNNGQEYANAGLELPDGKYLIGIDNRVVCLAQNGDSLWTKIYTGFGNIEKIFRDQNNNLMLATNIGKMIIVKINPANGDTISSHKPPKQFSNSGYKIIDVNVLPGGDYLLLFRNGGPDGGTLQRYTPGSSNFKWQNDYAGKSFKPTGLFVEDTTIVLGGYYGAINNYYFDLKIIKLSTNNYPLWEKQFYRRMTYKDGTVGLVKNNQNQYLLASNMNIGGVQLPSIHVLSNNGDSIAFHTISNFEGNNLNHGNIWKMVPHSNGFYATGMISLNAKDPDGTTQASDRLAVFNINQSGEITGINQFNDIGFFKLSTTQYSVAHAWGVGCISTSDGYCLSFGTGNQLFPGTPGGWLAQSVFKGYVVKTNVFKSNSTSIKPNPLTPLAFQIYPNPMHSSYLNIVTKNAGHFEIIDISNKVVIHGYLNAGENQVSLPMQLSAGIYYVKIDHSIQKLVVTN